MRSLCVLVLMNCDLVLHGGGSSMLIFSTVIIYFF